jgi:hypothetical protein
MSRTKSSLAFLLLLFTLAMAPLSALADDNDDTTFWDQIGSWSNSAGSRLDVYQNMDDKTQLMFIRTSKDGTVGIMYATLKPSGDPGPDANSNKRIERPDVAALIRAGILRIEVRVAPADSAQLSKIIDANGFGFAPHGNPGDQDNTNGGPGRTPVHGTPEDAAGKKTPQEIAELVRAMNEVARSIESITGAMGDVGDASENAPGFNKTGNGNNGKGVDTRGNYTENQNKTVGKTESLGPRPQYVNPPPKNKVNSAKPTARAIGAASLGIGETVGPQTTTRSATKLIGAGLLEGGTGLPSQGPSGTGVAHALGGAISSAVALGASRGSSAAAIR